MRFGAGFLNTLIENSCMYVGFVSVRYEKTHQDSDTPFILQLIIHKHCTKKTVWCRSCLKKTSDINNVFTTQPNFSKLQNYKIDHNRRPNRHHHHYHHDYYYHHFLSLSIFKSTKANDILLLPLFLSVCLPIFFFIKARGSEANPTCKMSTTCSGSVNNWSAMWQKSSSNTLSSWLDPSSLFFPWKNKKNKYIWQLGCTFILPF